MEDHVGALVPDELQHGYGIGAVILIANEGNLEVWRGGAGQERLRPVGAEGAF
jgi:hypothetical protein